MPTVRLERDYRFEAAHSLPRVPPEHKCARVHGHSYQIVVTVAGPVDPELGWLLDFADIDEVVAPLIATLDHRLLNDIEGLENPTSEHLAVWLWQRIRPRLAGLAEVAVSETATARCVYRGEDG
jgi:6-pyruvoyltetrahydropterin/6-carboxytetrahydropterin synthase